MSERSESADKSSVLNADGSLVDTLKEHYHVPALLAVVAVMLYIRLISFGKFFVDGEVLFAGNDAWYHRREVNYVVRHWPSTMPFDPWTYFPYGTSQGQFGTLYDQLVATVALVLGLGSPSNKLVATTLLVAPAVFGALTAIPVYYLGKRYGGRPSGLFAAVVLMLLPGTFLSRTMVGVADHNAVEPFFQTFAVLGLVIAFVVAEREKPIWELVSARDRDALRSPLKWSAVAGVLLALYMWVWPPGVLLVGVVGGFVVLKMVSDTLAGDSPEPIAFATVVSMSVTAVLMLIRIHDFGFSATRFSLAQPGLALAIAVGAIFLAWLARQWEARDIDLRLYPVVTFGLVIVGVAVLALVSKDAYSLIKVNFLRTLGFNAGAQTRTIGEAQPFLDPNLLRQYGTDAVGMILSEYGMMLFTGIVGAAWLMIRPLVREGERREYGYVGASLAIIALMFLAPSLLNGLAAFLDPFFGDFPVTGQLLGLFVVTGLIVGATLLTRYRAEELFLVVWAAFITSAAFTQTRFNYYLAIVVVILNAFLFAEVLRLVGIDLRESAASVRELEGAQVLTILIVVLVVFVPLAGVGAASSAWQVSSGNGPGSVQNWEGTFAWMQNNTPTEGNFDGAGNAQQLGYYDSYEETNDYDYPDGSYGVMSWWDYGHWITVEGERIPNANPFQQGATTAANYLLAPNEQQAESVLENMDDQGEGNQTRYVMVDWQMANVNGKFSAPIVFYDAENVSSDQFYTPLLQENNGSLSFLTYLHKQRYYDSQMVRLYQFNGSSVDPQPVVIDYDLVTAQNGQSYRTLSSDGQTVKQFQNMSAARAYVKQEGTAQIGGISGLPSERVPALEHYRMVKASSSDAPTQDKDAWVKTFERVDGAKVQGSGAQPNATVTASVTMHIPSRDTNFTYTQQAQANERGEFTMTLPYSTSGYDQFSAEDGYTNTSVRATGPYQISTGLRGTDNGSIAIDSATADVSEAKVVGEDDSPVTVRLETQTLQTGGNQGNQSSGDQSAGNASAGNETATDGAANESLSNGTSNADGANATNGSPSLAAPSYLSAAAPSYLSAAAPSFVTAAADTAATTTATAERIADTVTP